MGRVVQLEYGRSTSGRWFLAWAGWFYDCKSSVSGAVLNALKGGSALQGDFDSLYAGPESANLPYDGENGGVYSRASVTSQRER